MLDMRWVVLLLLFSMGISPGIGGEVKIEEPAPEYIHDLMISAVSFRKSILTNYAETLGQYVSTDILPWFNQFGNNLWAGIPPEMVWQRLFLDSQILITNIKNSPLVIYYSVWPDVYIITEWQMAKGVPKIIDAEIVSGDYFRLSRSEDIKSTPLWSRSTPYLLSSIGSSVSVSLKEADAVFLDNISRNWRRVGGLEDTADNHKLMASRSFARENVLSNLANIYNLYYSGEMSTGNIRHSVLEVQSMFYLEFENEQFDKGVISKDVKKYLENIDRESFLDARVTAVVKYKQGAWAFISLKDHPLISLAINLGLENDNYRIKKIEILDYLRAYIDG